MDLSKYALISANLASSKQPGMPPGFYRILHHPAPLTGCEFPFSYDGWNRLHEAGYRNVYCLCSENPRYVPSPLTLEVACELDDLSVWELPLSPWDEEKHIVETARLVAISLLEGNGCLVHCAAGRGRTGTVMGVALRFLGFSAEAVISHLNAVHHVRSGKSWPESSWQSDLVAKSYSLLPDRGMS